MHNIVILAGINECQDGITNECTQLCSIDNETMTYNCSCMNGYVINKEDPNKCDGITTVILRPANCLIQTTFFYRLK